MAARIQRDIRPVEIAKEMRRDLGYWLKVQREKKGLTQSQLAELLDLKYYSFVSQVENGSCRIPQELYALWADSLGVEQDEFAKTVLEHLEPGLHEILFRSDG